MSPAEREHAIAEMVRQRIEATPDELDAAWLREACTRINSVDSLRQYYADLLDLGSRRHAEYVAKQEKVGMAVSMDARSFVSQARKLIYARRLSAPRLDKHGKNRLAQALFMRSTQCGGVDSVDEEFMAVYLKELVMFYRVRHDLATERREDAAPWLQEQQRALEAAVIDRRVHMLKAAAGTRSVQDAEGCEAEVPMQADRLQASLYGNLLMLGKLYVEIAEAATRDPDRMRANAERAFMVLAMTYKHAPSPECMDGIRRINELQQGYLNRLARRNWKQAQLTADGGDPRVTAEHYYLATQYLNGAMARSVGPERAAYAAQLLRLKREFAAWHSRPTAGALDPAATP
jgi:hypothetical protein